MIVHACCMGCDALTGVQRRQLHRVEVAGLRVDDARWVALRTVELRHERSRLQKHPATLLLVGNK